MYENFGPSIDTRQVTFTVFLPDNTVDPSQYVRGGSPKIKEIRVTGDFQKQLGGTDWDLSTAPVMHRTPHPKGWLYTFTIEEDLPDGFYQYKYFVNFENGTTRFCSDPCTKYGGRDQHENSAFVIGGQTTTVTPIATRLPPKQLIMYELMIDDFTKEFLGNRAPIDAVQDKLDYLEDLGVNAIEFMPWTAWPGKGFSWGYDPFQFFSVEYRYVHDASNPFDKLFKLKTLINHLHARNMHVIMDGVFNHVRAGINPNRGFPYRWLYQDPGDSPYIGPFERGGFFEEFDYQNTCTQEFIRDVCLYWLNTYEIDGIRFDFTLGFYRSDDPTVGITKLMADVKDSLSQQGKMNIALMLEHLTDNRFQAIDDTNRICATGCWFDPFMFKSFDYARNGHIDRDLLRILNANMDYAEGKGSVTYIENHDHSAIVQEAGGRERWYKTQTSAIALLTAPGTVMIHNGQEFGEDYFLPSSGPDRVRPRPLRWSERSTDSSDFVGNRLYSMYRKLIQIRKQHPSLCSSNFFPFPFNHPDGYGVFPENDVVVYHRYGRSLHGQLERFIIILNYSDFDQRVTIPFSSNGVWEDLLNEGTDLVQDFRLLQQTINSNWGKIYYQGS
jgi:1,4-alpha-glucan branching enzyme